MVAMASRSRDISVRSSLTSAMASWSCRRRASFSLISVAASSMIDISGVGVGVGDSSLASFRYILELAPSRNRGLRSSKMSSSLCLMSSPANFAPLLYAEMRELLVCSSCAKRYSNRGLLQSTVQDQRLWPYFPELTEVQKTQIYRCY